MNQEMMNNQEVEQDTLCAHCKNPFQRNKYTPTQRFCSFKCSGESKKGPKILFNCGQCQKQFGRSPSQANGAKYCSRDCSYIASKSTGPIVMKICEICNGYIPMKKTYYRRNVKYCSVICSRRAAIRNKRKNRVD